MELMLDLDIAPAIVAEPLQFFRCGYVADARQAQHQSLAGLVFLMRQLERRGDVFQFARQSCG
jgi:hypothetical protein